MICSEFSTKDHLQSRRWDRVYNWGSNARILEPNFLEGRGFVVVFITVSPVLGTGPGSQLALNTEKGREA